MIPNLEKNQKVTVWVLGAETNLKFEGKISNLTADFIQLVDQHGKQSIINKRYVTNIEVEADENRCKQDDITRRTNNTY